MTVRPLTPLEKRILKLLADDHARSDAQIASALGEGGGYTELVGLSREIQRALPTLVANERLRRLMFGIPVGQGAPGQYRYEQKYVLTSAVLPVCLACFRDSWPMDAPPPQMTGNAIQLCTLCGRRTNQGAYMPKAEVEKRRGLAS